MAKAKKRAGAPVGGPELQGNELAADRFKALGDPTRLAIIRYLLWQSVPGVVSLPEQEGTLPPNYGAVTVGDIACFLTGDSDVKSSLSHHIKELRQAGLITVTRDGKNKICTVALPALASLTGLLVAPVTGALPKTTDGVESVTTAKAAEKTPSATQTDPPAARPKRKVTAPAVASAVPIPSALVLGEGQVTTNGIASEPAQPLPL